MELVQTLLTPISASTMSVPTPPKKVPSAFSFPFVIVGVYFFKLVFVELLLCTKHCAKRLLCFFSLDSPLNPVG